MLSCSIRVLAPLGPRADDVSRSVLFTLEICIYANDALGTAPTAHYHPPPSDRCFLVGLYTIGIMSAALHTLRVSGDKYIWLRDIDASPSPFRFRFRFRFPAGSFSLSTWVIFSFAGGGGIPRRTTGVGEQEAQAQEGAAAAHPELCLPGCSCARKLMMSGEGPPSVPEMAHIPASRESWLSSSSQSSGGRPRSRDLVRVPNEYERRCLIFISFV